MKKIILLVVALVSLTVVQLYSSGDVYESLQLDDHCSPTGNTVVYELEWISQDTLQVTVSERASTQGDEVTLYNLTTYTPIINGYELTITGGETKLIPFDLPDMIIGDDWTFVCECDNVADDSCVGQGLEIIRCANESCPGCCGGALYSDNDEYLCGGIVVDANVVIFVVE